MRKDSCRAKEGHEDIQRNNSPEKVAQAKGLCVWDVGGAVQRPADKVS